MMEGIAWFVLPAMLVVVNDIFAYLFGYFFGTHSLIELSPKKTWEGFIGGFLSTIVWAFIFAYYFQQIPLFVCPEQNLSFELFPLKHCEIPPHFLVGPHAVPKVLQFILSATVSYSEF